MGFAKWRRIRGRWTDFRSVRPQEHTGNRPKLELSIWGIPNSSQMLAAIRRTPAFLRRFVKHEKIILRVPPSASGPFWLRRIVISQGRCFILICLHVFSSFLLAIMELKVRCAGFPIQGFLLEGVAAIMFDRFVLLTPVSDFVSVSVPRFYRFGEPL